jgi:hypothetical protein
MARVKEYTAGVQAEGKKSIGQDIADPLLRTGLLFHRHRRPADSVRDTQQDVISAKRTELVPGHPTAMSGISSTHRH